MACLKNWPVTVVEMILIGWRPSRTEEPELELAAAVWGSEPNETRNAERTNTNHTETEAEMEAEGPNILDEVGRNE